MRLFIRDFNFDLLTYDHETYLANKKKGDNVLNEVFGKYLRKREFKTFILCSSKKELLLPTELWIIIYVYL